MWKSIEYTLYFVVVQIVAGFVVGHFFAGNTTLMLSTANVLTLILFLAIKACPLKSEYDLSWRDLGLFCLLACTTIIPSIWMEEFGPQVSKQLIKAMEQVLSSPVGFIVVILLGPLAEEVVFRGSIERVLLKKIKPWYAICISAFLFGLVHFELVQGFHAFLMGLLLGWLYYKTNSIIPCMIVHIVNNAVACVLMGAFPNEDTKLIDIMGSDFVVYATLISSLILLYVVIILLRKTLTSKNLH